MKRWALLSLLLTSATCFGQVSPPPCDIYIDQLAAIKAKAATQRDAEIAAILKPDQHAACIAMALAPNLSRGLFKTLEAVRTDKQASASVGSGSGTSSLISKGIAAKALSIASDYGALTQSVNGQTVTVKGSLDGIPAALIRGGLAPYCLDGIPRSSQSGCIDPRALNLLRRLSYGVSFDTSRSAQSITATPTQPAVTAGAGAATPVTFAPTGHQISAISGRFEIWNQRDTTSASYVDRWLKAIKDADAGSDLSSAAKKLLAAFQALFDISFLESEDYRNWQNKAVIALQSSADPSSDWPALYADLIKLVKSSKDITQSSADFVMALQLYDLAQDNLIAAAANKAVFTFEYANNRPIGVDSDSTFRVIFDKGFGQNWSFTANTALNVWDRDQSAGSTHVSRLRDVQAGAELDYKLTKLGKLINGAATLSGSYYFQDQRSAILLNVDPAQPLPGITFVDLPSGAAKVLASTGNIHIGQLKLVLGPGSNGLRVPIAFSYSNRSELVPRPSWKAQIGLSYDFDSLFTK